MRTTSPAVRAEPNVTPMIDVMLVLLIIFMAVGPVLAAGMRAEPPVGRNLTEHPEEAPDVIVGVDAAGRYFLNKVPMTEERLRLALQTELARRPLDRVVYLRADRDLDYAKVRSTMALASDAGATTVALIALDARGADPCAAAASPRLSAPRFAGC